MKILWRLLKKKKKNMIENLIKKVPGESAIVTLTKKRIRLNLNMFCMFTGKLGCLSEDTIVKGQTKTLGELYSLNKKLINTISITQSPSKIGTGSYYPKKSKSEIIDSGIKEVYEIELEDGRKVLATKEHKLFKVEKRKIKEVVVGNLKEGDNLRTFPKKYYEDYLRRTKENDRKKYNKKYNPKKLCRKCKTLFFKEIRGKGNTKSLCKSCLEPIKKMKEGNWFEWEDNLLRQFYYDYSKEKIIGLIHRTWVGIMHRAWRLNLKRNPKFMWEKNAWTSQNNPMRKKEIIEKVRKKKEIYFQTHSVWNKGIKQWENKEHPRGMLGKHHSQKIKEQISKSLSGEKAPAWKGGISFEPYDLNFNKRFKREIKERDNSCCQLCNSKEELSVHHIDYNKFNSNETNCITLCNSCHSKTNFNRDYWESFLSELLIKKYNYILCTQQKLSQ